MENKKLYEKHWIPDGNGRSFLAYAYQADFRKFIQPLINELITKGLDWKGLDEGIWWLHAHTKTSAYGEENSELESEVAKFSAIDLQDFKDGAVDKNWFVTAYKELGKARWELLYEAAKYNKSKRAN